MIRILKISLLFAGIMLPLCSAAQKDFGAWIGGDLRMPLSKKLDVGLQLESRFENNVSTVDQSFISPYLKFDLHKHIGVGVAYRFSNRPNGGLFGGETYHRIGFDVNFKLGGINLSSSPNKSDFSARLRFTHGTDEGDLNKDYLRARFKFKHQLRDIKLTPYVSAEFFLHFNDQLSYTATEVVSRHRFNKYRINIGMEYKVNKRHELNLFYIIQPSIESPNTRFILGLGYKYSIKRRKKD